MEPSASSGAGMRAAWEEHRPYLLAIAGEMLPRRADAEDVVQDSFARLAAAPGGSVQDARAWLAVVTRRLCLDRLKSADTRRTTPVPEPPEPAVGSVDPADRLTLDDEVRGALAVVIDRLSPAERTSFILHDVFGFPFDLIAGLVGRKPATCRQLARRARQSIRSGPLPDQAPPAGPAARASAELADRFIAVCQGGDLQGLVDLLDPDAAGLATVLGWPPLPPVRGAGPIAARVLAFFGPQAGITLAPFDLDGHPGVVARRDGQVTAVIRLDQRAGRLVHLHAIAKPPPGGLGGLPPPA